jgi:hypothetical protein
MAPPALDRIELHIMTPSMQIVSCILVENNAATFGGALHFGGPGLDVTISLTTAANNTARFGGALNAEQCAWLHLVKVNMLGNHAQVSGGAVALTAPHVQQQAGIYMALVTACFFRVNMADAQAGSGGAVYLHESVSALLVASTFSSNEAAVGSDLAATDTRCSSAPPARPPASSYKTVHARLS